MIEHLKQLNLSRDEEILSSRIEDAFSFSERKRISKFIGFLDLRQQKIAEITACAIDPSAFVFYGGFENAERKMFGVFPDYIQDRSAEFSHANELSHRDFLGSLMSLGIKRDIVGDILVGEKISYIVVQSSFAKHIIDSVKKIGNVGVKIRECNENEVVVSKNRFEEQKAIVTSLRLDCVVAALCNKSRAEASKFVTSERVFVNHEIISSCSKNIDENDVISVRSVGKFKIGRCISTTKKGRLVLSYKKYI